MNVLPESTEAHARREAGGKGYNLYLMTRLGLSVPRWVVLGASLFSRFRAQTGIDASLRRLLADQGDVAAAAAAIQDLFLQTPLPTAIAAEIDAARQRLAPAALAVRSSAMGEDSAQRSFAGQLSSFLYVETAAAVRDAVVRCWASAYSERCLAYRRQQGLDPSAPVEVAAVLQEMVAADRSGVLFTCDPVRGDSSRVVVNAVYGAGEGLVSGQLDADAFVLDKASGAVLSQELAHKEQQLGRRAGGGLEQVAVAPQRAAVPSLTPAELGELGSLARQVEAYYRCPQDIEWSLCNGRLYLLQSRPVTTPVGDHDRPYQIWDNSNIVESYGGITLPLTFSFARFVYHQVYVQFCQVLLVPPCQIRRMDRVLGNMLGSFYGRVYYNLLNWYRLTSILPLFRHNRGFMETMMGTGQALPDDVARELGTTGGYDSTVARFRRARTGLKFLYYHLTIQRLVDHFLRYFRQVYDVFRQREYGRMPANEILDDYHDLEEQLLRRWQAPIINDYLCMVHFGALKKLTARWLGDEGESLQNDLMCGEGSLESAEPMRRLLALAAEAAAEPGLRRLLEETPDVDCLEALHQSPYERFAAGIEAYIDRYGFRCMNEMKLEQPDLRQEPGFLFACLKNYLRAGQTDPSQQQRREAQIRRRAEATVRRGLRGPKRAVYQWVLRCARRAVRNRENTRFCRTRVYGVVRAMFNGIGRDFARRGIIGAAEDVFYLTVDEVHGAIEGWLTVQDLRATIALRRAEYARYAESEPATRFVTTGPAYWHSEHCTPSDEAPVEPGGDALEGTGCCPGVVEAAVRVVATPDEAADLDGQILVAQRTDPGWIPLYPTAAGLLVERGGLLSHSAIVAREMGLPTVVGVRGLTARLRTGMRVRMDGQSGRVELVDEGEDGAA